MTMTYVRLHTLLNVRTVYLCMYICHLSPGFICAAQLKFLLMHVVKQEGVDVLKH